MAFEQSARTYRLADVKKLFALSYNECALPACEERLADPTWPRVLAEICHIYGLRRGSPRYVERMSDEERNAYENLVLLCRNCHVKVDYLVPEEYPADRLFDIKRSHEERRDRSDWCPAANLDAYVEQLALTLRIHLVGDTGQPSAPADRPPPARGGGPRRIRLYELARELGVSNEVALDLCVGLGIEATSHSTSLPDRDANRLRNLFDGQGESEIVPPPSGTSWGTVKWFDPMRAYGFIVPDDGAPDVFVHRSQFDDELTEGDRVTFDVVTTERGPQARNVRPG